LNKLSEPKIFFSVLSTVRFSKNEKCSLYSKNKAKDKNLISPNFINNNIHYSVNGMSNRTKKNKKDNNKINNKNMTNNHFNNNYFHRLSKNINDTNNKINNIPSSKSNGITSSDNIKSQSFKYNSKIRKSFEMKKHA
jgi:hypothetical protein